MKLPQSILSRDLSKIRPSNKTIGFIAKSLLYLLVSFIIMVVIITPAFYGILLYESNGISYYYTIGFISSISFGLLARNSLLRGNWI